MLARFMDPDEHQPAPPADGGADEERADGEPRACAGLVPPVSDNGTTKPQ